MAVRVHSNQRRARWTLFWTGVTFLLVQLSVGYLLDYHWLEARFPSAASTLAHLREYPSSPEIICLGSSRFGAGFREDEIQCEVRTITGDESVRVFNAAIEAGDLITADFIMERLLAQGTHPKLVVIEVSPETVARKNVWLGQHVLRELTWEDAPVYFTDICRSGAAHRLLSSRTIPLYIHRRMICRRSYQTLQATWSEWRSGEKPTKPASWKNLLVIDQKEKEPKGWHALSEAKGVDRPRPSKTQGVPPIAQPLETKGLAWDGHLANGAMTSKPGEQRTMSGARNIGRWLEDYEVGGTAAEALERLLQRCQQHGMTVILVAVPVSTPHRQLYTPEIDEAFLGHIHELSATYRCQFVDYRARIPDPLFQDNHHLLREGGNYFSRQLAQETIAPAWVSLRRNRMP